MKNKEAEGSIDEQTNTVAENNIRSSSSSSVEIKYPE